MFKKGAQKTCVSANNEKKLFLNEAAEKEFILFLEHDAVNECCTVHQTEKGIRLKQVFKLADI